MAYGTFQYSIFDPPAGHPVYNKPMPGKGWANNSLFSFWGSPFSRPAGVKAASLKTKALANATGAVVHMFHGSLWGGWQYSVSGQDEKSGSLTFGYGGFQEARGASIHPGTHFFVENLLSELDAKGEWFFDPKASTLYVRSKSLCNRESAREH